MHRLGGGEEGGSRRICARKKKALLASGGSGNAFKGKGFFFPFFCSKIKAGKSIGHKKATGGLNEKNLSVTSLKIARGQKKKSSEATLQQAKQPSIFILSILFSTRSG